MGVQVNAPVRASICAPAGAAGVEAVGQRVGRNVGSVAVAVNVSVSPSAIVWSPIAARTGAVLTSVTVTVIVSESI